MKILHVLKIVIVLFSATVNPMDIYRQVNAQNFTSPITRIVLNQGVRLLALGEGSAWVWNSAQKTIEQIDLITGSMTGRTISLDFEPLAGSVEAGALWLCSQDKDQIARIDLTTYQVATVIDIRPYFEAWEFITVVTGDDTVWIKGQETVLQIDPRTNRLIGEPISAGEEAIVATVADGALWVGSHDDGLLTHIDARTNKMLALFDVGFSIHGLAVGNGSVWVLDEHGFEVVEINPYTETAISRIPIEFVGSNIVFSHDSVWVAPAAYDSGRPLRNDAIVRIDPHLRRVIEKIHVGSDSTELVSY
jgi:DNA-binding beta-propeller fold protein YncE